MGTVLFTSGVSVMVRPIRGHTNSRVEPELMVRTRVGGMLTNLWTLNDRSAPL